MVVRLKHPEVRLAYAMPCHTPVVVMAENVKKLG
jgi:hypothetical protein